MSHINTVIFDDLKEELGESKGQGEVKVEALVDPSTYDRIRSLRRNMRVQMSMRRFHLTIISLVGIDLVIVMIELIVALLTAGCSTEVLYTLLEELVIANPTFHASDFACSVPPSYHREIIENGLFGLNLSLLCTFAVEVFCSIFAFGPRAYCSSFVSLLDGFVVFTTLFLDIYFHFSDSPSAKSPIALVVLRLWKVFRAVHAIAHALEMHYEKVLEVNEHGHHRLKLEHRAESSRLDFYRSHLITATGQDVDPDQVEKHVQFSLDEEDQKRYEMDPANRGRPRSLGQGVIYVRRTSSPISGFRRGSSISDEESLSYLPSLPSRNHSFSVVRRGSTWSDEGNFPYLPALPLRSPIKEGLVLE